MKKRGENFKFLKRKSFCQNLLINIRRLVVKFFDYKFEIRYIIYADGQSRSKILARFDSLLPDKL